MPTDHPKFRCRHIQSEGTRCAAPVLVDEPFCYRHHEERKRAAHKTLQEPYDHAMPKFATFPLPALDGRTAILTAISEILQRVAANLIDDKRAKTLLYGLQVAISALPPEPRPPAPPPSRPRAVEEVTHDPVHGPLAPVEQIDPEAEEGEGGTPRPGPGYAERLYAELMQPLTLCVRCGASHANHEPCGPPSALALDPCPLPQPPLRSLQAVAEGGRGVSPSPLRRKRRKQTRPSRGARGRGVGVERMRIPPAPRARNGEPSEVKRLSSARNPHNPETASYYLMP